MDYAGALAFLDAHVNLELDPAPRAASMRLDGIRRVTELMGHPQRAYPVVHVTGTNGKGSVARMASALLAAHGLSVGTYTSPHLERINERLAWNGAPVEDDEFAEVVGAVAALEPLLDGRSLSHFEILTAAAFRWFADIAVDVAVVEVGLGGRYDATNVADATVAVVTNVDLDHAEVIGPTRRDIAREKAGIVKPGATLVLGETDRSLRDLFDAEQVWARGEDFDCDANRVAVGGRLLHLRTPGGDYPDVFLPLHGAHQGDNAAVALAAAEAFFGAPLHGDVVAEAFAGVTVPGRMEVMGRRPLRLVDGAHNPAGAQAAAATIDDEFAAPASRVLVVGMLQGRDPVEMLAPFDPASVRLVVACPPPSPRALPAAEVAAAASSLGVAAVVEPSVEAAVARALREADDDELVLATGSLYVAGAARAAMAVRA